MFFNNLLVQADIQNAVNGGKTVTVSKTDINFHGWVGCGYIITDPATGAGSYMIGGGLSGGWLDLDRLSKDLLWASYMFLSFAVVLAGFPFAIGLVVAWSLSFANSLSLLALSGAEQDSVKDALILGVDFVSATALLAFMGVLGCVAISIPIVFALGLLVLLAVGLSYLLNRVVIEYRNYSNGGMKWQS